MTRTSNPSLAAVYLPHHPHVKSAISRRVHSGNKGQKQQMITMDVKRDIEKLFGYIELHIKYFNYKDKQE